jgi:hypothetical protein
VVPEDYGVNKSEQGQEGKQAMANMKKEAADTAVLRIIANIKQKFAELDALDEQFADLDAEAPMDGMMDSGIGEQFDLLSDKREELEQEIRSMRERVQLISEWEKFKGGGWSDDIQSELNSLDQQFATIADGASSEPMGAPMVPPPPMTPEVPGAPAPLSTPEVPADAGVGVDETLAPPTTEPPIEASAPPAEPLAAPMASTKNAKINEKTNYELQDKKGSKDSSDLKKGDTHMANQPTKPSLKEKLAEAKNKREAITKEAKTRVASAWTIAKTMLPTAPDDVKKAFAASLLSNSTKVLKAALRQTAINAHYTKVAETFKEVHKVEMNDLLEDPSILNAEKKAVSSEVKGDAKNAGKVADDRKDAGPQEGTYNDGRGCGGGTHTEPKELDASKAGERPDAGEKPGQTQNLSDGKTEKAAAAKCDGKDCKGCPECKKKEASCADCKDGKKCDKHANAKKADFPPAEGEEAPVEAPAAEEAPVEAPLAEEAPAELPPPVEGNPEAEATEILTDEKKQVLEEKIDEAQAAIKAIESEILSEGEEELDLAKLEGEEEGLEGLEGLDDIEGEEVPGEEGQELDFSQVFNEGDMEDKAASLANEGDEKQAGEEDDFFAPSAASSLEASLDDDGMADMHNMFSMQGADGDPLAALIGSLKTAEQVAGMEVVESFSEAAEHFKQDEATSDDRDNESDHSNTLWAETIKDITPEEQGAKRTPQDSVNQLEKPKAAVLKKIKTTAASDSKIASANKFDVGEALFGKDED